MSAKLVGYARVSTAEQSLDVQIDQLTFNGCDRIFSEKASGAQSDNRQELQKALRYLQAGDTLVICKLDRIARSTKDLLAIAETLTQRGIAFRILNINVDTATPTGKMMLTILGAVATFERDIMFERQAEGIKRARAAGVYKGRTAVKTPQHTATVLERRAQGIPHTDIAAECGIGVATVYRICAAARQQPARGTDQPARGTDQPAADPVVAMRAKYGW